MSKKPPTFIDEAQRRSALKASDLPGAAAPFVEPETRVEPPPLPPEDAKPFWEHSGFRTLVASIYALWLPFLLAWLEPMLGREVAICIVGTLTLVLSFFGVNAVTQQAEARGRQQMARNRPGWRVK